MTSRKIIFVTDTRPAGFRTRILAAYVAGGGKHDSVDQYQAQEHQPDARQRRSRSG